MSLVCPFAKMNQSRIETQSRKVQRSQVCSIDEKKNVKEEEKKGNGKRNSPQAFCYFNQHDIYMNSVLFN